MRCNHQRETLDALGHSELWQRRTDAGDGNRPRRLSRSFSQSESGSASVNFREIAHTVINASQAEQTEVLAIEQDESLTRFANNCIHQNVTERNIQITVRSVIGTKVGIAVSNDIRPDSLRRLA